jgi:hypothetical protein
MLGTLKKLDVGDITAYERYVKEQKRAELIATTQKLYGENIPEGAVLQIERELAKIPSIFSAGDTEIDAEAVQFLLWRSVLKSDPDATYESVGEMMSTDNMAEYIDKILPVPDKLPVKKKAVKKARKKKPKSN